MSTKKKSGFEKSVKTVKKLEKSFEKELKDTFKVKEEPKKVDKEDTDTKKLRKWVEESSVCSLCSQTVKGRGFRLVKTDKKYNGKPSYKVICGNAHNELQAPNTYVAEADTKKGFTEVPA